MAIIEEKALTVEEEREKRAAELRRENKFKVE